MARIKTLPKKLFVKIEHDNDTSYFVADKDLYGLADMGESVRIGTYQLVEVSDAETVVKLTKRRS